MKSIYKIKSVQLVLSMLLLSVLLPGVCWAIEAEQVSLGPINTAFAVMLKGQEKSYTVTSKFYPDLMIVGLVVYGSGNMVVTVTKTDTSGELIGVLQIGAYSSVYEQESQKYASKKGITPCTIQIVGRFFDYGYGVIISGLLASFEEGPHSYKLTISYS